jgi:nicotinamide mononucleotide transporter
MTPRLLVTRLFGGGSANREQLVVALSMLAVTAAYEGLSTQLIPSFRFDVFEFVGTWTGLVCVWLSRTRNILCWPWGIVSSLALGGFFGSIALPGQQWLNWGYFVVIQLWAWPFWAFGGAQRAELPVTTLTWGGRAATLATIAAGTLAVYMIVDAFAPDSFFPILDSIVVAASVVAQFLLGRKKVESWLLWLGPVNLLSIVLFVSAGAYTVAALYVALFVHALFALAAWRHAQGQDMPAHANV